MSEPKTKSSTGGTSEGMSGCFSQSHCRGVTAVVRLVDMLCSRFMNPCSAPSTAKMFWAPAFASDKAKNPVPAPSSMILAPRNVAPNCASKLVCNQSSKTRAAGHTMQHGSSSNSRTSCTFNNCSPPSRSTIRRTRYANLPQPWEVLMLRRNF